MSSFIMPRHRLHPSDRLLTGRLHLPADLDGFLTGDNPERPVLLLEVHCPECDQVCRYPFPGRGDPRMTAKLDLCVPIEAPACKCPPFYVGLDDSPQSIHNRVLDEFKRLVRTWDHARSIRRPEIRKIMADNQRLRLDMLGYEF